MKRSIVLWSGSSIGGCPLEEASEQERMPFHNRIHCTMLPYLKGLIVIKEILHIVLIYLLLFFCIQSLVLNTVCAQFDLRRSLLRREALKYPWLSIHIHDSIMKGRSGIFRAWNLQETPWTQELKKNTRKNMKESKKERKARTTSHCVKNHKITNLI
jgi:hypothetical protein